MLGSDILGDRGRVELSIEAERKLEFIAEWAEDASRSTPDLILRQGLRDISEGGDRNVYDKGLVILLDTEGGNGYRVSWYNANMKVSEMVALLEYMLDYLRGKVE